MGEIVSQDVLDWARDLAAIQKLLAGDRLDQPAEHCVVLTPGFGASRESGSGLPPPTAPQPPSHSQAAAL